ncbi:MAG: dTDP-4-dehydrorhamnose reductase [Pigmentiphaga sp.]|nr:dTDP-4-dehydrorhamnose reductase [Pigmentiphaga sp.]
MVRRRILLLGSRGQLGHALARSLAPLGEITAPTREQCDLYDPGAVLRLLERTRPDCIVNAAAYTAVDAAEHHPALAMQLNASLPALLAEAAGRTGAWLVHYSSDYVYSGRQATPYTETDATEPLNTYGRSKLAGDQAVAGYSRHLILRTGWVFHRFGANFLRTILRRARQQTRLQVVDDQLGAPNSAEFIAAVTAHVLRDLWRDLGAPGLYHVASQGHTSWYGYACHLLTEAGRHGLALRCSADTIQPISSQVLSRLASRPAYAVLDTARLCDTFDLVMPPWQLGVSQVVQDILRLEAS